MERFLPGYGLTGRARWLEIVRCATFWLCLLLAVYWAAQRQPPLAVLAQQAAPVAPGHIAQVQLRVRRDLARGCAVSYHQRLYDAAGYRFEFGSGESLNAEGIAALERATPGQLVLRIPIPQRAASGPARLVTSLHYVCNPLHLLWPIPLQLDVPIDIT
jgi:hypothetical protein